VGLGNDSKDDRAATAMQWMSPPTQIETEQNNVFLCNSIDVLLNTCGQYSNLRNKMAICASGQ
jgi:hypothetical protein